MSPILNLTTAETYFGVNVILNNTLTPPSQQDQLLEDIHNACQAANYFDNIINDKQHEE